ncbi:hypothetical protein AOLI_G00235420 [Acnodon oligacanthus]
MTVALLTSLRMSRTVSLLVLIFIPGVVALFGWRVQYYPKGICALKGSTVTMTCLYQYPESVSAQNVFWSKILSSDEDLLSDPDYRDRVQNHGNQHHSTLRLSNVTEKDQRTFYCRNKDNRFRGNYRDRGVDLSVTDLQVEVPERVIEGGDVTLTCKTTCSLPVRPTFTWYRNGRPLSSSTDQLHLQTVNRKYADRYHCAVLDQNLHSPDVTLNVRYLPKSISVSFTFSGETLEGSSVTLTCSSDAIVQNYTWFKEGRSSPVGSGRSYSFIFDSKSSGWYYCLVQNEYGSIKSAAVPVIIKEHSIILYVVVGVGLCGIAALIAVVLLMNKKMKKRRTMEEDDHQNVDPNAKDDTYTALDPVSRSSDDVYSTLATVDNKCRRTPPSEGEGDRGRERCVSRVVAQDGWRVNYDSKSVCALKGSDVIMGCTYTPPSGHSVQKAFWTKEWGRSSEPPDLLDDPKYKGRVQYLGDHFSVCTLKLMDVREKDQSKYYFRFITHRSRGKYQGAGGVALSVTDLQVEVPERVIEGGDVTLTCKTTCSLTVRPTFTWYRNGRRLSYSTDQLRLQPVSREDAGRYRCAVLGQNLRSPEVPLNVRYGPKSISVSISPAGEISEGSSVNLTCNSDANPPVQNYTWFKEGGSSPVGSGHGYRALQSGSYYCVAQNEHGSQTSAAVTVTAKGVKSVVLFAVVGVAAGCGCLFVIIVLYLSKKKQGGSANASKLGQRVRNPRNAESSAVTASGTDEEVQYASVQHRHDQVVQKTQQDEAEYTTIRFTNTGAANRSDVSTLDDASVIYSSMK